MIAIEFREGIWILRLDRPAQRNALIPPLVAALVDRLRDAAASSSTKAVILSGNGPAFCVGADLKWFASLPDPALGVAELVAAHHLAITTIVDLPVPVIAAVNGATAGGGIGLALAPDYCIASDQASFTAGYFRLGLTPDGGSSVFLERSIGPVRTHEMLLTNRRLTAQDALAWGMLNQVVPHAELIERAVAFTTNLPAIPPYTLLATRRLLDAGALKNQLQLESVAIRTAAKDDTFRQAVEAFRRAHPD